MTDLEYTGIDSLLYPDIDSGYKRLSALDKYGKMRLEYLHVQKPEMYRNCFSRGNWQRTVSRWQLPKWHFKGKTKLQIEQMLTERKHQELLAAQRSTERHRAHC